MMTRCICLLALAFVMAATNAWPADAEADWKEIVALDAGPREPAPTAEAARDLVVAHLGRQEKALRAFLLAYPRDAHAFEARIRLARLLQVRADFGGVEKLRAEAARMLDDLEKTATPEQRPEVAFAKVAMLMRNLRPPASAARETVLAAARKFAATFPSDRRIAALLAEVATLFDTQPKTKEALLMEAQSTATDEELKARIADDLTRVRLFGHEISFAGTTVGGGPFRLEDWRGKPVLIIFFSTQSPPSLAALPAIEKAVAELPKGSVEVLGVSLDFSREDLAAMSKTSTFSAPILFDGKGWESPLARTLGINALPTVWLLDQRGRLRSLNALPACASHVRQLLAK